MSEERKKLTKESLGITPGLPLQVSDGDIDALRKDIQLLMDIEAIKQVKHAYFRCIDTANLEELGTLFHEDVTVHFIGGTYEWQVQGLSLIHISEPTRPILVSRMPSSA